MDKKRKEKLKKRLVHFAKKHLGKPYKYGARIWEAPRYFDCSSFVQYLYKRIGIDLPRTALEQAYFGKKINLKKPAVHTEERLEIGDLIFLKGSLGRYDLKFPQGIGHVAIYIGEGKVVSAYCESMSNKASWEKKNPGSEIGKVKQQSVKDILKRKDLVVIKRIL